MYKPQALSICVLCSDESEMNTVFPAVWFNFYHHDPSTIYHFLENSGADPQLAKIVDCRGFHDYMPKDIEEAYDLAEEYDRLEDRSLWPFFLKCYREPTRGLVGLNFGDLERAFRGFYGTARDYVQGVAKENGDIDADSPLFPFIDWFGYADSQRAEGRIAAVVDPASGSMGVFDLSLLDTSGDLDDSIQKSKPGGEQHESPTP